MARHKDLQPWLDYFELLRTYEQKGFLEMLPDKHEAYITQPALHAISDGDVEEQLSSGTVLVTARRIRTYAAWKSQHGGDYLSHPFALHVVGEEFPHDLLYTLLLTRRRVWWKFGFKAEHIEVIDYNPLSGMNSAYPIPDYLIKK